jgi:hypothetical protein
MIAHTFTKAVIYWSSRYTFDLVPLYISSLMINEMMLELLFVKEKIIN